MKQSIQLFIICSLLFCRFASAQFQLGTGYQSPQVYPDNSAVFRINAPNAKQVSLHLEGQPAIALERNSEGLWEVQTPPLKTDIYTYFFTVDGVRQFDLANPDFKDTYLPGMQESLLTIPAVEPAIWQNQNIAHGNITEHFFQSALIGDNRSIMVYTPPGYDPEREEPYPVLYLLHGIIDDQKAWFSAGKANTIFDNLINKNQVKPMLIVTHLGYGVPDFLLRPNMGSGETQSKNNELANHSLLEEVIPLVETNYHVSNKRSSRAVAGLSMGGAQALLAGLHNPDKFAYVGGFSSALVMLQPDFQAAFNTVQTKDINSLSLLWLSCGEDDFLAPVNTQFKQWLEHKKIRFESITTPGAHNWQVWRDNLADFLPRLFTQ